MQKKHRLEKVHHRRKWLISANIPIIWSTQWAPIALKVCAPYGRPASWGEDLRLTNVNECETLDDELTFVWVLRNWLRDSQFSSQDCIFKHPTNLQWYDIFPFFIKAHKQSHVFSWADWGPDQLQDFRTARYFPFDSLSKAKYLSLN